MGKALEYRRAPFPYVIDVPLYVPHRGCCPHFCLYTQSQACGLSALGLLLKIDPNASVAPPAVYRNAEVALGLPLGTNVLLTGLIIGRIWYISQGTPGVLSSKQAQLSMVFIESGALVVFAQLPSCVLFVLNHPAQNIATCSAVQCYVCTLFSLHGVFC
jgi:hypothetical protein